MKKLTFYPGCSLHSTAVEYDESTRAVFETLGYTLEELADWNCCGASSAHATDHYLSLALPVRNLVLAEKEGVGEVATACAACYNALRKADHAVRTGAPEAVEANESMVEVMGRKYGGGVKVVSTLELLSRPETLAAVRQKAVQPLRGLKVAPYYGCLLTRPAEAVAFEDPEQPTSLDRVLEAAGAEVVRWSWKTECCGASLALSRPELLKELARRIIVAAREAGAQAIATACPMCHANLDYRQSEIPELKDNPVPVYFVTELLGLAFGLKKAPAWVGRHLTESRSAVRAFLPAGKAGSA
ncbi:MAG: CoB--CoM heterodisulfide reductase iron-sulfur subunit B family protein [Bacillota bacterium]